MRLPVVFMLLLATVRLHAQVAVFTSGEEGHKSYRIPAIIHAPNGDLLAFAEGRVHGSGDYGDVNIVMKRSTDNGKTWSSLSTVVDYDVLQAGNPAPVVDVSDPPIPKTGFSCFIIPETTTKGKSESEKVSAKCGTKPPRTTATHGARQ
jgi:sialidase-1